MVKPAPGLEPDSHRRTDHFRHGRRHLLVIVGLGGALLVLLAVAVVLGPPVPAGFLKRLALGGAAAVLGALVLACIWFARRPPVALVIGPDGLCLPFGWRRPLAWSDIHRIRRLRQRRGLFAVTEWLVVDPSPGVLPAYRLAGPRRIERWLTRRYGIRIPLSALDADPESVIASIERFRPVTRQSR